MKFKSKQNLFAAALVCALAFTASVARAADPLPSWNDGPAEQSIITFVEKVTRPGSPDFVPVAERIATFDNDGTLWCDKPLPVQLYFALDRVKALAPEHPEWKTQEPFASLLKGDLKTALAGGDRALLELLMATHTDKAAGLGFLSLGQKAFSPIVFAMGTVVASQVANAIVHQGATLSSMEAPMIAYGALAMILLVAPLLVVTPVLIKIKKSTV